jgi:hypothetical protein
MEYPFDQVILDKVGFSEEEARAFIKKHQTYLGSLTEKEHRAVAQSLPSWGQAAAAIDPRMTAADLQDFVARRGETPAPATALCFLAVRSS